MSSVAKIVTENDWAQGTYGDLQRSLTNSAAFLFSVMDDKNGLVRLSDV